MADRAPREHERDKEHGAESESGREVGPAEAALRRRGPRAESVADGEEQREKTQKDEGGEGGARRGAQSFLHFAFTKFTTASARFLGMSFGLSMRRVRPVAR